MIVRIGNFLFRYRNGLFPAAYLLLFFPSRALFENYWLALALGFSIAFAGQLVRALTIGLEYIVRGGRNRQVYADKLVQGGVFAHCRNPLYLGNYLILLGVGIAANSVLFLCVAIPFFTFAYWAIIAAEESYLRSKFGMEFDEYCLKVNRVIPKWKGFAETFRGMHFNWRRLVTKEYGSAFIWMAAVIMVVLKNLWIAGQYDPTNLRVRVLWGLLVVLIFAYATARFLKKKRLLDDTGGQKAAKQRPEPAIPGSA